jgi:hypothetical protein
VPILPAAVRPYTYQIMVVLLIPLAFFLDSHTTDVLHQDILGAGAWLILIVSTRFSPPTERRQVWIMVGVASCIEVWSSIVWGIYRYRFGNVPLWVPPGHGLVYLFALRSIRTPFGQRHGKMMTRAAVACATAWAIFGVSIEPIFFHRLDILGAAWWPLFIWFMCKPSAPIYAAAFFVTSFLELWGTNLGNWAWQAYAPVSHIPTGNPPSVIAAGYCLMDYTSITIAAAFPATGFVARWIGRSRLRVARSPG